MKEASNDLKEFTKKPAGLEVGRIFKPVKLKLTKQRKELSREKETEGRTIKGSPVVPGVAEGLATVITNYEDPLIIIPDTILVCPHSSPVLTPLFSKIKGLIADTGGILTSMATIAREYEIPTVVGTSKATELITSGDKVYIDGISGQICFDTNVQLRTNCDLK